MNEFHIKSQLLRAAIWGGTGCYQWDGYTNADKGKYGRALIEFFATRLFSIHRIPGYEPKYQGFDALGYQRKFGKISEEEFEDAYAEFKELYLFTQKELEASGLVIDGKVKLNRSLRPFETDVILPQLLNNEKEVEFPSNIITSYAHDGSLFDYGCWMSVIRDVPVELIVMYNECLYHPESTCANRIHGGESEVWVVESNMFGYTKLSAKCFVYKNIPPCEEEKARIEKETYTHNKRAEHKEGSVMSSQMINYLSFPCACNKIAEHFVKKEKRKIEKKLFGECYRQ